MKWLSRFLSSTRLAVILIAWLALSSAASTLLKAPGFFRSPWFLAPALLFIANLSACSVSRIARELRKKRPSRRHGPDLLHAGLLVLAAGAVFSLALRREAFAELAPGDSAAISDTTRIRLESFESPRYPDGRPRDYLSRVTVLHGEDAVGELREISVNHPLKIEGVSIYQASRGRLPVLYLRGLGEAGKTGMRLLGDSPARLGDLDVTLRGRDEATGRAILDVADSAGGQRRLLAAAGDRLGAYEVGELSELEVSGLKAVSDPGWIPSLIGLLVTLTGSALTLFQKLKDAQP
jgi:cytochrome c biogenesis protein